MMTNAYKTMTSFIFIYHRAILGDLGAIGLKGMVVYRRAKQHELIHVRADPPHYG